MLRYRADLRTLLFMAIITALLVVQWQLAAFNPWLWALQMFMIVPVSVIAHNHNHVKVWKNRLLNRLTDYWITLFYGFPAFAWIPTHNRNHHVHANREGDYTRTWRYTEANNLITFLTYPTISGVHQQKAVGAFLFSYWRTDRKKFVFYASQIVLLVAFLVAAFLIDWRKALLYVFIPQQFTLFVVLLFNYLQHVHADEESEWNGSRNFTGWFLNAWLFNNGYHTVHHAKMQRHWSESKEAHAKIEHLVDPSLNEKSMGWYIVRTYLLAPFFPKLQRKSMRTVHVRSDASTPQPA